MTKQAFSFLILFCFLTVSYGQKTLISGNIKNLPGRHSIKCSFIPKNILEDISAIVIPVTEGTFKYELNITKTVFLSFAEGQNYYAGFIQSGDSIVISYDTSDFINTLSFKGKGNEKFKIVSTINKIKSDLNTEISIAKNESFPVDYLFSKIDSIQKKISREILSSKSFMNVESLEQLNGYLASTVLSAKYSGLQSIFEDSYNNILLNQQTKLSAATKKSLQNLLKFNDQYSNSFFYIKAVYNLLSMHYDNNILPTSSNNGLTDKYAYLNKMLSKNLKAPVLFLSLKNEIRSTTSATIEPIIQQCFPLSNDSKYKAAIASILDASQKLKPGSKAPNFSVEDLAGSKVSLTSLKGKVIYLDFWFAACTPCHKLFEETKPAREYFKLDSNIVFLIVSIDSRDVWEKAINKFNIEGYHVYTENKFREHPITKSYGVTEYPTTFLIGRDGEILSINPPHNSDELKSEIDKALQAKSN
ncbi:MAG: TlpA family protein disulfide reductase [Bacteroidetes bacterium]|nr:TlpA family protein disulfide reductase [Bacteroidota bacterium]